MKNLFLFISLFTTLNCISQNDRKLVLNKGQKLTVRMTSSMEADMSMGMQMKNQTSSTNVLNVIADNSKQYTLTNTLTKLTMSMDAMGQQHTYDSEKPSDKDSDIGKSIAGKLNVPDTLSIDRASGIIIPETPKTSKNTEPNANPLENLMRAMGGSASDAIVVENAVFIIPSGKKAKDTWTDSSTEKNMRTVRTYTITSLDKNSATINMKGTVIGNTQAEMQGTQVDISMDTKTVGDIIVDVKSGLVSKRTINADIKGNIDLMGQSMPIVSKTTSTFVYE